jgi:signal transduction histidine kinase
MVEAAIQAPSPQVKAEENRKPPLFVACFALVVVVSGLLFYFYRHNLPPSLDYMLIFAVASTVILAGMFGLYYHAYNFYHDDFYLFVSLGWLANAVYILFEGFFAGARGDVEYGMWVNLFMIVSLIPFYLAGTLSQGRPIKSKNLLVPAAFAAFWLIIKYLPGLDQGLKYSIATFAVSLLAFYSLFSAGRSLIYRLNPKVQGPWATRLVFTFYAYAYMQFVYLVSLLPHLGLPSNFVNSLRPHIKWIMYSAFGVGLFFKIINSIAALSIIRHDYADLRVRFIQAQDELKARRRFEEIGILTATILHEIRTPLGVLETKINLMKGKNYHDNSELVSDLEEMDKQRSKIFYVMKIIPYLSAEREFHEGTMEKINVGDLINKSIKSLKTGMNTANISFIHENQDEAFFTKADPQRLEEVFLNIFKNAVEAIREARRETGRITIRMDKVPKAGQLMRINIIDNGCGIPPQNIPEVTKALFSTRADQKPNSGLGLFITEQIVKIHNGKLEFASTVGVGTTVSITLPLVDFHKRH